MRIIGIETSCDETSVAIVENGVVLSNAVSSQVKLHSEYGGVVPELATREHLKNLLPVAREALRSAGVEMKSIDAIAATRGPGLPNALLIGFHAGQALALAVGKPFIGVHHHEAHLFSPWIGGAPLRADFDNFEPSVSLIVSGGHTMLVHVRSETEARLLGSTIDDAAGECFDKTAKLIGLPYPGGPHLDRLAQEGNPKAFDFPRPMLRDSSHDFSFSGLKTAVRYCIRDNPELTSDRQKVADLCASVQAAIVELLVTKTVRAAAVTGVRCVTASGGVTCNSGLRKALESACAQKRLTLRLAKPALCTDNAGMIAILAERHLLRQEPTTPLDAEIMPSWPLEEAMTGK